MARYVMFLGFVFAAALPGVASAPNGSLFSQKQTISALFVPAPPSDKSGGSLFEGTKARFFAPIPKRSVPAKITRAPSPLTRSVAQLLDLIAAAEAGPKGYDAVQYGAKIKPSKPPTKMTLAQIYAWTDATPGQPHAIGRYQFIPKTLKAVVKRMGYSSNTVFSPKVQDRLALVLLKDAGLKKFQAGTLDRRAFMKKLARIWAGLPLPSGKSYYDGYAGNAASISWVRFETGMARIFPSKSDG